MIVLENNWVIDADKYGYILQQKAGFAIKQGKEVQQYKNQTYHVNLMQAMRGYKEIIQKKFIKENMVNVEQLINFINDNEKWFKEICLKVGSIEG